MSTTYEWSVLVETYVTAWLVWYSARTFRHINRNRPIVSKEDDGKYLVRRDLRRIRGGRYH